MILKYKFLRVRMNLPFVKSFCFNYLSNIYLTYIYSMRLVPLFMFFVTSHKVIHHCNERLCFVLLCYTSNKPVSCFANPPYNSNYKDGILFSPGPTFDDLNDDSFYYNFCITRKFWYVVPIKRTVTLIPFLCDCDINMLLQIIFSYHLPL